MALTKDAQKKILKALKYSDEDIAGLVDADSDSDVTLPEGLKILSSEEFTKATENVKKEGITIGKEIAVKDLKEKAGLDFEGKSADKFLEEYKKHTLAEANLSVDEKVKDRDKTIQQLKESLTNLTKERDTALSTNSDIKRDVELLKLLPKDRDPRFSDEQYLTLLKSEFEFTEEEGKPVVKKGGEVLKSQTFDPLGYGDAITEHFTKAQWIKAEGGQQKPGMGGGDSKKVPGAINNMREFREYCKTQNWDVKGEQAQAKLAEVTKSNQDFNFNEN